MYCTNVSHYDECSAFCRYRSIVQMLRIILIIPNINSIATTNTFTMQWHLSMSFQLTSRPTLSGSFAMQLFNDHCSPVPPGQGHHPEYKQPCMQSILGSTCEMSLTGQVTARSCHRIYFLVKEVPENRTHPFILVFSSEAFPPPPFYCWSFICNSFAICFHMVVNVLKKILVCVRECEQVPMLTIHRYYQQQLVLGAGTDIFC